MSVSHLTDLYATAYIVRRGQRFTVALIRVEHGTPMVEVLKRLLHLARQAGIRPRLLLLDRGFYSVAVIRYLYQARYPFVMPVVRRGRSTDDPRGPSGTQVFAEIKRSGWHTSTLTNADKQPPPCGSACTAATGKGGADGMGANLWCMPVGESVSAALTGFIKPTACASGLRPATANSMRPGSKPPPVTPRYDSCSSPSP
jgi:hypothetical protein